MVDWAKRIRKGAAPMLHPGEEVLGAAQLTPVPFSAAGAGLTGGMIAGGALGAAVGAAWDRRRERRADDEAASRALPEVAGRPARFEIPERGALVGVTPLRIVALAFTGMGKAGGVIGDIPIGELEALTWMDLEARHLRGAPRSRLVWLSTVDGAVVAGAMIAASAVGRANETMLAAIERVVPGVSHHFAPPSPAGE